MKWLMVLLMAGILLSGCLDQFKGRETVSFEFDMYGSNLSESSKNTLCIKKAVEMGNDVDFCSITGSTFQWGANVVKCKCALSE